jgi:gliding motility-associated-like protein
MKWILSVLIVVSLYNNTFARDIFVGGAGALDSNPGTATQPFATIQKAASVAVAGDVVKIRGGIYRETIVVANSGVTFQNDQGAIAIISGLNVLDNTGWTLYSGNIYKKSTTLPVNGYNTSTTRIENNTTIFANQIFKDGEMMFEARWPNISNFADLLDRAKYKNGVSYNNGFNTNNLTDAALSTVPNLVGATLISNGWFMQESRTITGHSGSTINWSQTIWDNTATGQWSRKRYYVTGKLGLLDAAKEWHYENGTLYFYQPGGGAPTGTIEYKARNWGFDIRGKSNITIAGLTFKGCDPAVGNAASANTVIDNIRASYMNHHVRHDVGEWQGVGMSKMFGMKLIGANSIIKNSELHSSGSSGVWLGANGRAENNLMHDMGYVGYWANPISLWDRDGGQVITKNTIYRTGRSCFDFGYNWNGQHLNVQVSYNDFSQWGMISQDVGATYAWGQCILTGLQYHHNWIHDTGAPDGQDVGINVGIYFDQSTGPGNIHHNVVWNAGAADMYHETMNETRTSGAQMTLYNNTFANTGGTFPRSYVGYRPAPLDIQRNNIYRSQIILATGSPGNIGSCLLTNVNPQFIGTGQGGLAYRLRAGSPAINTGLVIPGVTDGSIGAPDMGAYEFGGPDWVPGYTAVPTTIPANTPPTGSITAPANNTSFAQGAPINITATAADANGSVTRVEFFDGTTKLGEDTSSPYSFAWNNATVGTHTLTVRVTDNDGATTTSTPVTITVTGNTSPTVSITAPANNAQVATGATISITATAADANGTVTKVEFFDGTTKLGEDVSSPYTFAWTNATAGAHALTAKATDNQNNVTTSTAVNITVAAANSSPTVAITSPANNAQVASGSTITITATAADANGSVTKVEFFAGTTKLGEDLTSPYSFAWNNAAAGSHALTARATDNQNNVTTSAVVSITVTAANTPPTAAITSPSNSAQLTSGSSITITASATDVNGSVTKVEFFDGTTKLGQDLTNPYSFIWSNAAAGAHTLTIKATDNQNNVTTSAAVNITIVSPDVAPTVSITGPADNTQFTDGTSVTITATASDTNGSISKVEFFDGNTKIGEDVTNTYSFAWDNIPAGTHIITVKATDDQNNVTTSSSITIVVGNANIAPLVSIAAPLENSEFATGGSISITASASDPDGSVTKVEFFEGTTKLGEDLTAPYTFIWNNVPEGSYALNAVATDNENGVTTSESIDISVTNALNPAPGGVEDLYSGIPRFFSPNGDGTGDYWEWTQPELFANSLLTVFNRSGQRIFEALSYNNTWDGKSDGQALQPGDYYYVIKMTDLTELKGSVRILR